MRTFTHTLNNGLDVHVEYDVTRAGDIVLGFICPLAMPQCLADVSDAEFEDIEVAAYHDMMGELV